MTTEPKHSLKIADTPTEDEAAEASESADDCSVPPPAPPTNSKSNQPGKTQRLSPDRMDEEIDRVNRLNGTPTLARDTCQDE